MANYGDRIELKKNIPVVFPDFTIEYIGEKKEDNPHNVVGYSLIEYYTIITSSGEETLSWGGGGLVVELVFEVNGVKYSFEPWKKLTKIERYYIKSNWYVTGYIVDLKYGDESPVVLPVIRDKKKDNYLFLPTNPDIDISQKLKPFNQEEKYKVGEKVYIKIDNELQYSAENLYTTRRNPLVDLSSIKEILFTRVAEETMEIIYRDTYIRNQIKNFE